MPTRRLPTKPPPPEHDVPLVEPPAGRMAFIWWQWLMEFLRLDRLVDTTARRPPDLTPADTGFSMFDTTLGKPIWWDGDSWIEAIGSGGMVSNVTATAPLASSGGTIPNLSLTAASASADGYLTAANFNVFNAKAPTASPAFTGTPTAPTAAVGTTSTTLATTAFVMAAIAAMPASLQTAEYTFSTTSGLPPSTGQLRVNNATQPSVTEIYLHYTNAPGVDIRNALRLIKAPNTVLVQDKTNAANHHYFVVTGDSVDNGSYFTVPVTWTSGGPNFTPGRVIFAIFGLGS